MNRSLILLLPFLIAVGARAQVTPRERAVLDTAKIVIRGELRYELQREGEKTTTYYANALPVAREDLPEAQVHVRTLPEISTKRIYPTPVRHGRVNVASTNARVQHFGNVMAEGYAAADLGGLLASGDAGVGGGLSHVSNAEWYNLYVKTRARHLLLWSTAFDAELGTEVARTGVYDQTSTGDHRTLYDVTGGLGVDHMLSQGQIVRVEGTLGQRSVMSSDDTPSEQAFFVKGSWQRSSGRFWVTADASLSGVHTIRPGSEGTAYALRLGAYAWTRLDENWGGALGANIYTVRNVDGDSIETIRPMVAAWARPFSWLKFNANLSSGIEQFGLVEAYRQNPMVDLSTPMRQTFRSIDLNVNAEATINARHSVEVGLRQLLLNDYPVWTQTGASPPGEFIVDYTTYDGENFSISSFYARYRSRWGAGTIDGLGIYRFHSVKHDDVPYVPNWETHLVSHIPVRGGIMLSPSLKLIGPRSYRPGKELDPYVVVDFDMSLNIWKPWMLEISLRNLIHQQYERWYNVKEPGFHLQIGVRRTF
jgi:hypothetical protein